jgi:hypothetical protein
VYLYFGVWNEDDLLVYKLSLMEEGISQVKIKQEEIKCDDIEK